jgi:AraC-like DNA-binding protein
MYIESKLKEVDKALFEMDFSGLDRKSILSKEVSNYSDSGLKAAGKIQFTNGLLIIDTEFNNKKSLTNILEIKGEYIQVSYLKKRGADLILSGVKQAVGLGRIQCCYDLDTRSIIKLPANQPIHCQAIYLSKDYYLELLKNEAWIENNTFYKKVLQGDLQSWGACQFPINYNLYHILNEIAQANWEEDFKFFFIELRLKELFLSLHLCQQESLKGFPKDISEENREKIKKAHAYLIEHFKSPPTIKVLARKVLLNELQLKKDFKKMYGKTIRSFVIELRMEKAKSLLGKYTVSEMAGILGYKSIPHFINTFKKCYGYTPKQGLNQ